ncbi:hypothetical protein SK066_06675 [Paenibacillus hunanensis]|uniref:hypothetical protein n=1 Tax=Paenibacillus hunanensis TaxID=539262 RepID=UPI002A69DE61|nr:hypothetical protein [Paenibacillus hunanensis]WPP42619.1 hypothetical protein SK066_06675 [Paenibacillus hunanensis]
MKVTLDVTGSLFDRIDMEVAYTAFYANFHLPHTVNMEIYGCHIIQEEYPLFKTKPFVIAELGSAMMQEGIFIIGKTNLTITGVQSGSLSVSLYHPDKNELLRDHRKKIIHLHRNWSSTTNEHRGAEYVLGGTLEWPRGQQELILYATGQATMEFDTEDCITGSEYVMNPEKYTYKLENEWLS